MTLGWYVHRLASMSPSEIVHRVGEQVRRRVSRSRSYGWSAFPPPPGATPILPGLKDRLLANLTQEARSAILVASERALAGEFSALGVDWPKRSGDLLFPADLWRLDPVSGKLWPGPETFCFAVNYRHERTLGDIKYVWEINRLQLLQPLAAAYALTGSREALGAVEAMIVSWTDANPPFQGVGWNSGIEVGLRAVSVMVALSFCGDDLSADVVGRAGSLLTASLHWLLRYPSGFSSANNHLVAEAMGEYLIATALPGVNDAARVAGRAKAVLEREALLQILADGVAAEQSPTYGAFTAEMLLLCAMVGRERASFDEGVAQRLLAFAGWIAWIADDANATPAIGDDDEGRVLSLTDHEHHYAASVAQAISGFLNEPIGLAPVQATSLRNAVFGGAVFAAAPPAGLKTFVEGGYSVVREERANKALQLVFDHGPLGYLSIAAHGHADALSFVLNVDGQPVLVDPGTYLYHSGGLWRDWFRGTAAHNTLTVNGQDSSTISGPFNWAHKATAELLASDANGWKLEGRHDGYRGRFGIDHQRTIAADPNGFTVTDRLTPVSGDKPAGVEDVSLTYQLAAGLSAREEGGRVVVSRSGHDIIALRFDPAGQVVVHNGAKETSGGWISQKFGVKVSAARVQWSGLGGVSEVKTIVDLLQ